MSEPSQRTGDHAWPIARQSIPGWVASALLHLLFAVLVLALLKRVSPFPERAQRLVPIDIVQVADVTRSPAQRQSLPVPQQRAVALKPARRSRPIAATPAKTAPPADALEARLRALSRLRAVDTKLPVLDNAGPSNVDAMRNGAAVGPEAEYSLRDFVRTQVLRRWNLNIAHLAGRNYTILLHIRIQRNGIITTADIVDTTRFTTDARYRDVALSARNAVLLSSPISLPLGVRSVPADLMLKLNSADALR